MKQRTRFTRNAYGIQVKRCCASCQYKDLTRAFSLRRCMKHHKDVEPSGCCKHWVMSGTMKSAGCSMGVVRDKDTKEVIID